MLLLCLAVTKPNQCCLLQWQNTSDAWLRRKQSCSWRLLGSQHPQQATATPAPGDLKPLASWGTCPGVHIPLPLHIIKMMFLKNKLFVKGGGKATWLLALEALVPGHFTKLRKQKRCADLVMAWKQPGRSWAPCISSRTKLQRPNFLTHFPVAFQAGTSFSTLTYFQYSKPFPWSKIVLSNCVGCEW